MIPISLSVMAGGLITIVGTSTNISVQSVAADYDIDLNTFDITPAGLVVALGCWIYLLLFAKYLPTRQTTEDVIQRPREYLATMLVKREDECGNRIPGSRIATGDLCIHGKSAYSAGLRSLPGVFLVGIERNGIMTSAPGPEHVVLGDDRLFFAGSAEGISALAQIPGLKIDESVRFVVVFAK
jgi:hypothetical protein